MERSPRSCFRKSRILGQIFFCCSFLAFSNSVALANGLPKLSGRWVKTSHAARSDQPGVGAWIKFDADGIVYQSWAAPATLLEARGQHGANFVWRNSFASCWYEISRVETETSSGAVTAKLTLKLVKGDPPQVCLEDSVFEPAPAATTGKPVVRPATNAVDGAISKLLFGGFRSDRSLNTGTSVASQVHVSNELIAGDFYKYSWVLKDNSQNKLDSYLDANRFPKAINVWNRNRDDANNGTLKRLYLSLIKEIDPVGPAPMFVSQQRTVRSAACWRQIDIVSDNIRSTGKAKYTYEYQTMTFGYNTNDTSYRPDYSNCKAVTWESIWIVFD